MRASPYSAKIVKSLVVKIRKKLGYQCNERPDRDIYELKGQFPPKKINLCLNMPGSPVQASLERMCNKLDIVGCPCHPVSCEKPQILKPFHYIVEYFTV